MNTASLARLSCLGLALLLCSCASTPTAGADDRFADARVVVHAARGAVSMLEGVGGNIGVSSGPDGVLLVDDQFAELEPKVRAALRSLGSGDRPVFVLNTHWHGDHTGGNEAFGRDAHIIAHANVRSRLGRHQHVRGKDYPPKPKHALPIVTFDEGLSVHFNGEEIQLWHFPAAHTDGDAVVWFSSARVAHLGDIFFHQRFPFVDLESGGNVRGVLAAVDALIGRLPADAIVIPGHGPVSDMAGLRAYGTLLRDSVELVSARLAAGDSLEAVQAAGMPERYAALSSDFIPTRRWLEIVYRSLTAPTAGTRAAPEAGSTR